jgi:hypothetical protein
VVNCYGRQPSLASYALYQDGRHVEEMYDLPKRNGAPGRL